MDRLFFRSILMFSRVLKAIDSLAVRLKRIRPRAADRKLTKWITVYFESQHTFRRSSAYFASDSLAFSHPPSWPLLPPPPPPPPAVTTVTVDPSRLIYVFAQAKLSYFIIARHCSYSRLYRRAIVSAPRWLRSRLGEEKLARHPGSFHKFLSLSRDRATHRIQIRHRTPHAVLYFGPSSREFAILPVQLRRASQFLEHTKL